MENKITTMPRYRRSSTNKPKLVLQPRDIEIIKLVYSYRLLDSVLIRALISGSNRGLLSRLQKLYHNGYLDRIKRDMHKPIVYALGNRGADLLAKIEKTKRGKINWQKKNLKIKEYYIEHTLQISRFRAVLELALRKNSNYKLVHWISENELKEIVLLNNLNYKSNRTTVIPDGFFSVQRSDGKQAHFFLEADRSTMTRKRFLEKMKAFWQFRLDNSNKEIFGIRAFRVLTVCKSTERAKNLRDLSTQADPNRTGSFMFWFTSEENYNIKQPQKVLDKIWLTAGDSKWHFLFG